jgi:uncharacterized membrane protein
MWTTRERLTRDLLLFHVTALVAGASGVVALATARPLPILVSLVAFVVALLALRFLMRCQRCGRSVLWWSARHSDQGKFLSAVVATTECPYCGFDGAG